MSIDYEKLLIENRKSFRESLRRQRKANKLLHEEIARLKALTPLQPNEKGETYTRSEVEGLLNKFCNEIMVGQASGKIPKHSNGIAQYIIDNF